jgi:adenylate cyclase
MPSGQEIERKWLISGEPAADVLAQPGQRIDQGYLTIGAGGTETRIRKRAGEYILGVKAGSGLIRDETSELLSAEQFDELWPLTEGARIQKTRHVAIDSESGATIELDVYERALSGLVVAEVEFADEAAAAAFIAPPWFGKEVTDDPAFKNQSLAVHGRP